MENALHGAAPLKADLSLLDAGGHKARGLPH
jgi:hypothetical protein